jgi:hypothetical protein
VDRFIIGDLKPLRRLARLLLGERTAVDRSRSVYERLEQAIVLMSQSSLRLESEVRAAQTMTRTYFFQSLLRGAYRERVSFTEEKTLFRVGFSERPYYVIVARLPALVAGGEEESYPMLRRSLLSAAGSRLEAQEFLVPVSFDDVAILKHAGGSYRDEALRYVEGVRLAVRSGSGEHLTSLFQTIRRDNFTTRRLGMEDANRLFVELEGPALRLINGLDPEEARSPQDLERWDALAPTAAKLDAVMEVFRGLLRAYDHGKKSHNVSLLESVETYLQGNYGRPDLGLTVMPETLGISENYLSNSYKEQTGERLSAAIGSASTRRGGCSLAPAKRWRPWPRGAAT